jgi:predicted methyltransferase
MIATRKVRIPQKFYDDVHAILKPGANMIVTEDSMEEGSPGAPLAVLSNS